MTSDIDRPPPPAVQQLTLTVGAPANGGSCVARHDGRVVFVRYALPGEQVRVRVTADRGSYWHAETIEVIDPSADRTASICPIAGVDGAGCCDLAFVEPAAARALKGEVVSNQLARLGNYEWSDQDVHRCQPTGRDRVADPDPARRRRGRPPRFSSLSQRRTGRRPELRPAPGGDDRWPDRYARGSRAHICMWSSTTMVDGMWRARCATGGAMRPRWSRAAAMACSGPGGIAGRCR